jgi:hypothetical protein
VGDSRDVRALPGIVTFLVTTGLCASALAVEVDVDCARLDAKQTEELRARARLALRAAQKPPRSLLLACDEERAWVVWDGPPLELVKVVSEGTLLEAALDTIETRARQTPPALPTPSAPATPRPQPPPPAREVPIFEPPPKRPPPERPVPGSGGAALGIVTEIPSGQMSAAAGPRLDMGVGWGPIYVLLNEQGRFGSAHGNYAVFLFDFGGGIGYGAPLVAGHLLGASLTGGLEYFSVVSTTRTSGVATLSLRAALPAGPISLAAGVDGRLRFAPQFVGEKVDVQLPRWTGMFVLEAALQVEPIDYRRNGH